MEQDTPVTERELVLGLLKLLEVRMASGQPAQHFCSGCFGQPEHNPRNPRKCLCICHKAREWLELTSLDPDLVDANEETDTDNATEAEDV